jgi:hypothetical protein
VTRREVGRGPWAGGIMTCTRQSNALTAPASSSRARSNHLASAHMYHRPPLAGTPSPWHVAAMTVDTQGKQLLIATSTTTLQYKHHVRPASPPSGLLRGHVLIPSNRGSVSCSRFYGVLLIDVKRAPLNKPHLNNGTEELKASWQLCCLPVPRKLPRRSVF